MENENLKKKDASNEKIILFVIGVLVGAVVSTATFFVYTKTLGTGNATSGSSSQQMRGGGGTPPEMPSGQNQGGTPPEMPNNTNSSQNSNN